MKKLAVMIAWAGVLAGCATQPPASKRFWEQEAAVVRACIPPVAKMTVQERFTVDPSTRRSPMRGPTQCYADSLKNVATMQSYNLPIVMTYTDYLVRLVTLQDRGEIDRDTAIALFGQAQTLFRQAIEASDAKVAAQSRRDFGMRLAALGAVVADQDRQRAAAAAANRPVVCTLTGVYVQNTVVCN